MNATDFLKAAIDSGIIAPEFLASYAAAPTVGNDAESLSDRLVDEGRMTAFQSQRIRDGKADELTVGPYVLMELLGQGGMGTVYKAQHKTMRRLVALKVITEAGLRSAAAIRRFAREAEAAARLDHPNIVAAYDAGEVDGDHYLVMQLIEGRSLLEIIQEDGPQLPRKAVDWVLQAAHGLAYAHGRGVIHRDIKPGNLLLDHDGSVKILDMGLARLESLGEDQDQLTDTGQVIGTVDFMAPEQAIDTRSADARSDIYSLGVTLWYLVAGRPMFAGDSVVQRIMAHQQAPPPSLADVLPGVAPRLDAVFQKMVAKRPDDRFQSMHELIAALEALPHELQSSVSRGFDQSGPAPGVLPTRSPTWRMAAVLATAFGAVAIAVVGFITIDRRRPHEAPATPPAPHVVDEQPAAPAPAVAPFDATEARRLQTAWAEHLRIPVESINSTGVTLVVIPPGRFTMGPPGEFTKGEGQERVRVTLTRPFLVGQTEITQAQWRLVMGTEPWKGKPVGDGRTYSVDGDDVAATHISWNDAVDYCTRLTARERLTGRIRPDQEYRLPTEAEWEHACRAGTVTAYCCGDDPTALDDYGWYGAGWNNEKNIPLPGGNTRDALHAQRVRLKRPNAWGLHDMHGNAMEWCQDTFAGYPAATATDPIGPREGSSRVTRGGSWAQAPTLVSSPFRLAFQPSINGVAMGLRVVLSLPEGPASASAASARRESAAASRPAVAAIDAAAAAALQQAAAAELGMPVEVANPIGATLVLIPSGRYRMGENQFSVDVTLTKPFLLGKTEVTQGQWRAVMETEPWKGVPNTTEGDAVAATMITWDDAEEFCRRLTDRERAGGGLSTDEAYRLPTEAEWEYACRAGTVTKFSFGGDDDSLGLHAWFGAGWDADNDLIPGGSTMGEQHAHDVGLKRPNPWGLHDMHGNVFEWVSDWYRDYPKAPLIDPAGPSKGGERVARGGSWAHAELFARSSYRARFRQTDRNAWIGFRLARSLPETARAADGGAPGPRMATSSMPAVGAAPPAAAVAPFDAEQALRYQQAWSEHLGIPVEITTPLGVTATLVPPGTCTIGEGKSAARVTLSRPFRIGQMEVTQAQWKEVMGTEPWKNKPLWDGRGYVTDGDDIPVTNVSWLDAATFCQRLTERERADGTLRADEEYRLPTEAEWEYACRAGTTTRYSFGDDEGLLGDYAWHGGGWDNDKRLPRPGGNTGDSMHAHAAMQKKPNPWGLHDMHGNVSEWCRDWFGPSPDEAATDPAGPPSGSTRVVRGGDWSGPAVSLSSSLRRSFPESFVGMAVGFRVVRTISHTMPVDAVSPGSDHVQ